MQKAGMLEAASLTSSIKSFTILEYVGITGVYT
jgi:hypothetical protein